MKKRGLWLCMLAAAVLLAGCQGNMAESADRESGYTYGTADWVVQFDSVEQAMEESDVCILGTVISEEVRLIHDLYFTYYDVQAEDGTHYTVVMTGGYVDGEPQNLLMPLLEEGKTYFLCLNGQIYHDEQIYNIGGGDQGYGLYDPETGIVTAVNTGERALFSSFEVQKGLYGYNIYNLEPAEPEA